MTLPFLFRGLIVGFSIAAPVGPIGVLCIRRSLAHGARTGLATGLGAATADGVYGSVAAFGLTAVSGFLVEHRTWLGVLGGLFLCYLGARTSVSTPQDEAAEAPIHSLFSAYASTFVLTLTNPMTILSFVAIFAGLGLGASPDYGSATAMVAGVFLGSALWWLLLSSGAARVRSHVGLRAMRLVNQVSGAVIFAFGAFALSSVLRQ